MSKLASLLVALGLFGGCSSISLVRVAAPESAVGVPAIDAVIDLGGLPLPEAGELNMEHSDGWLTPGEWAAVVGQNLGAGATVTLGDRKVPMAGHLEGGSILIRVPRGMRPGQHHSLSVKTAKGEARTDIGITSYVVGADTDGNRMHFTRIEPGGERFFSEDRSEITFRRAKYHTFSPDGALLYGIQTPKRSADEAAKKRVNRSEVMVVHLGAKGGPEEIATFPVELGSPLAQIVAGEAGRLVILADRDLAIVDAKNPAASAHRGRLDLMDPQTGPPQRRVFTDLVLLDGGRYAAALEAYGNTISLIDLADPDKPRIASRLSLAPGVDLPVSVDLAPAPEDPKSFWLLQGPNFRVAGKKLARGVESLKEKASGLYAAATGGAEPERVAEKHQAGSPSRLARIRLHDESLHMVATRPLPQDFYPFFLLPRGEEIFVSGVNGRVLDFSGVEASLEGVKQVLDVLLDTTQFGRIVKVAPDGSHQTVIQGLAVYFNLDAVPGGGPLLYSVWRLGARALPPSLHISWGPEAAKTDHMRFRALDAWYVIPPYSYGIISVQ